MKEVKIVTSEQQTTEGAKKEVRFYDKVRRRCVESLIDEDLWYSNQDYMAAREKERQLRNYVRKTTQTEGSLNAQGIMTRDEFIRKRANTNAAKLAVFEEQESQEIAFLSKYAQDRERKIARAYFVLNDEKIEDAYYQYSHAALAQAQHRAMTHQIHVHAILSDPNEKLLDSMPTRGRARLDFDSPLPRRRRSSASRTSLLRPGKRFPRPSLVFRTDEPVLVVGCTTPAA